MNKCIFFTTLTFYGDTMSLCTYKKEIPDCKNCNSYVDSDEYKKLDKCILGGD